MGDQRHVPAPYSAEERLGTNFMGGWVDFWANVDGEEYLATTAIRSPDRRGC